MKYVKKYGFSSIVIVQWSGFRQLGKGGKYQQDGCK